MPHPPCELCGQRPAIVFITQMVDDTTTKHRFCEHCAREKARGGNWPLPLADEWDNLDDLPDEVRAKWEQAPLQDVMLELLESEGSSAQRDGFDAPDELEAFAALDSAGKGVDLDEFLRSGNRLEVSPRCPSCSTTWNTIKSEGRAGCAACYAAFRDQLGDVMGSVQRGESHVGKAPRAAQKRIRRLEQLRKRRDHQLEMLRNRLKEAVASEKYEDAAKLRDKIKSVGG